MIKQRQLRNKSGGTMLEKFIDFVEKNNLIKKNDSILVGISGGPDSMMLIYLLKQLSALWNLDLHAVHCNHQLRETANRDENFVSDILNHWKIPLSICQENITKLATKEKIGIEEAGHKWRKEVFRELCSKYHCDSIALGHHRDDRIETFMINLLRGSGHFGLSAMRPKEKNLIRPLIFATKKDILEYLQLNRIPYCIDESNTNKSYFRNRVRLELLPLMENYNSKVKEHIYQTITFMQEVNESLRYFVEQNKNEVWRTEEGVLIINKRKLKSFPRSFQKELIRSAYQEISKGGIISEKLMSKLMEKVDSFDKYLMAPQNLVIHIGRENIRLFIFSLQENKIEYDIKYDFMVDEYNLPNNIGKIRVIDNIRTENNKRNSAICIDPYDEYYIRNRKKGDFVYIDGLGHKKVKKIFQEKHIPKFLRQQWPIIYTRKKGIIWIPFLWTAKEHTINCCVKNNGLGICMESVLSEYVLKDKSKQEDVNE